MCPSDDFPKMNAELMGGLGTASLSAAVASPLKAPEEVALASSVTTGPDSGGFDMPRVDERREREKGRTTGVLLKVGCTVVLCRELE